MMHEVFIDSLKQSHSTVQEECMIPEKNEHEETMNIGLNAQMTGASSLEELQPDPFV